MRTKKERKQRDPQSENKAGHEGSYREPLYCEQYATQMKEFCDSARCRDCPSFDLCRKRVLIVGGIERMESQYRRLVEKQGGGILEYHAGHMRGGRKQLEHSLQRADVVLCPVNCNSHGACVLVKNLAKKYRKPLHMMPNFSLNAITGVISAHAARA